MSGLGGMRNAEILSTKVLLAKPKRYVCEILRMPDGHEIDWYYSDTPESVMVVPIARSGNVIMIKQYRHNLKTDTLELPAGVTNAGEPMAAAALRELVEETGHTIADPDSLVPLGRFYALPSETNKYVNFFLASPTHRLHEAQGDTEIEKYFEMSTVEMPFPDALAEIGRSIHGIETAGALMLAARHVGAAMR